MPKDHSPMRMEHDSLGAISVPFEASYGAQTQRSVDLFPCDQAQSVAQYPALIDAMLLIKVAAAQTNAAAGLLDQRRASAIVRAAFELIDQPKTADFPVHAFHGGGGIALHMNVNEVLARHADRGGDIHPIEHVNLNHSTSDCLSTACHIAVRQIWSGLHGEITALAEALHAVGQRNLNQRKLARTCLQDACDIGVADYFGGLATQITAQSERGESSADALAAVNIGGNIIGRRDDCDRAFFEMILPSLNKVLDDRGLPNDLTRADNLFAASQSHDGLQAMTATLDQFARTLIRICKDLRLMASGPHSGFGEIALPTVQPGSSAIPGKVNPAVPEFVIQSAMKACGLAHTIRMTEDHGELDYNPWQMVVVTSLLDLMELLHGAVVCLRVNCIQGLTIIEDQNRQNAQGLVPSLMQLKRERGYSAAAAVAKKASGDTAAVRAALNSNS